MFVSKIVKRKILINTYKPGFVSLQAFVMLVTYCVCNLSVGVAIKDATGSGKHSPLVIVRHIERCRVQLFLTAVSCEEAVWRLQFKEESFIKSCDTIFSLVRWTTVRRHIA